MKDRIPGQLQHYHKTCCKKGGCHGRQALIVSCHMQFYPPGNYIPVVILIPNYTSLPFIVATFLTTHLMVVLQSFGYFVFHGGDTSI